VAEASPRSWRPPRELEDDVRRCIRTSIGLSVATVTIVAPGSLERTSSGKVKRRACSEAHRRGTLTRLRGRDRLLYRAGRAARNALGRIRRRRRGAMQQLER